MRSVVMRLHCFVAIIFIGAPMGSLAQTYRIVDLNLVGAGGAKCINDRDEVVGWSSPIESSSEVGTGAVATYWHASSSVTRADVGGDRSVAEGINNHGQIVGYSYTTNSDYSRGYSIQGSSVTYLPTLGGSSTRAYGVNDSGVIVGWSNIAHEPWQPIHAFRLDGTTMSDLGTLDGIWSNFAEATAVNNAGVVVGRGQDSEHQPAGTHAFSHGNGTLTRLGTLGGSRSWARDINASGWIVGESALENNMGKAAFLYKNGAMQAIAVGGSGVATSINDSGLIVGTTFDGFLYDEQRGLRALLGLLHTNPGWTRLEPTSINSRGAIVGSGTIGGRTHAFLMEPVPEPPTLAALGLFFPWFLIRIRRVAA